MNTSSKLHSLPPKILGISGTFGSGKDTIAAWLNQQYGYFHVSTGDMVREVAHSKYGNIERPTLLKTANELRQKRGSGVLVDLAYESYQTQKSNYPGGIIIGGIRSTGEAKVLRRLGGLLLFIDAPVELRYKRIHQRARSNEESLSLEEFIASEDAEHVYQKINDDTVQNLGGIEEMADEIISNNYELPKFLEELRLLLGLPPKR